MVVHLKDGFIYVSWVFLILLQANDFHLREFVVFSLLIV
jgi:hypothetical protein